MVLAGCAMHEIIQTALNYLETFDGLLEKAGRRRRAEFARGAQNIARDVGFSNLIDVLERRDPRVREAALASAALRYQGMALASTSADNQRGVYALAYLMIAGVQKTAPAAEALTASFLRQCVRDLARQIQPRGEMGLSPHELPRRPLNVGRLQNHGD